MKFTFKKFFTKKRIIIFFVIGGLIFIGIIFAAAKNSGEKVEYITAEVKKGDLTQTVSATGTVQPAQEIDMNFKITGKLDKIFVKVGDKIKADEVLAELDEKNAILGVKKAQASLALAQANLDLKLAGQSTESIEVSSEDVAKAQASLNKAKIDMESSVSTNRELVKKAELDVAKYQIAYDTAKSDLENTNSSNDLSIKNAYNNARVTLLGNLLAIESAIREADNILGVDNTTANDDFENYLGVEDPQTETDAVNLYKEVATGKPSIESQINSLNSASAYETIDAAILSTQSFLNLLDSLLNKVKTVLDNTITGTNFTLTGLDTKKSDIDSERSAINNEITSLETDRQATANAKLDAKIAEDDSQAALNTAKNNLLSAKQALDKAKVEADNSYRSAQAQVSIASSVLDAAKASLELKKASPRNVDLAALRARVDEAKAGLELAQQELDNTRLISPIQGIVTAVNFEEGEQTSQTKPVITVLDEKGFKIEVDISESDIAKVSTDDPAKITFDAFGEDRIFMGKVSSIEPAETVIQDVVYYKVDIILDDGSGFIKSGMTANVDIITKQKKEILMVPQRAVVRKDGRIIVRVLKKRKVREVEVKTGLKGDEGLVEIISGLKEGEKVITFIKEKK